MKKNELKSGMVVKYNDGRYQAEKIKCKDRIIIKDGDTVEEYIFVYINHKVMKLIEVYSFDRLDDREFTEEDTVAEVKDWIENGIEYGKVIDYIKA